MGKFFNIAGPCNPEDHYMLPATARVPDVMRLVADKAYFVVHAQRQCGKTTAFRTLVDDINATGQVFEPGVAALAYDYSRGQPYLVNALARWCMDKIHDRRFGEPITLADMHEAKEKIIRERVATLNSIWKRLNEDWMKRTLSLIGHQVGSDADDQESVNCAFSHGVVAVQDGVVAYSCPIVQELIAGMEEPKGVLL